VRYFIQIKFKGTNYHGWQLQPNATSVQEELNKALSTSFNKNIETMGCGRTDTGVHASKFYAHFNLDSEIEDIAKRIKSLNFLLPQDISVDKIIAVNNDAHARFDATYRTYHYFIHTSKNPFINEISSKIHQQLNFSLMNEAAQILLKYTDFGCFCKSHTQLLTNLSTITKAQWNVLETDKYYFEITANRFLRNMVRAIVGTLFMVGEGKITVQDFEQILISKDRRKAGKSVDACGLFLVDIVYPYI
jgi:tRNA pseudouridine38-40 synthase